MLEVPSHSLDGSAWERQAGMARAHGSGVPTDGTAAAAGIRKIKGNLGAKQKSWNPANFRVSVPDSGQGGKPPVMTGGNILDGGSGVGMQGGRIN
jgi:hypothetical protein